MNVGRVDLWYCSLGLRGFSFRKGFWILSYKKKERKINNRVVFRCGKIEMT